MDTKMISKQVLKNKIENSRIVVIRCHGTIYNYESYLILDGSNISNTVVPTSNYVLGANEFSDFDLSGCELIIFSACESGARGNTSNLVDAAYSAGAQMAIGFTVEIYEDDLRDWTNDFFAYYCNGYSAETIIDAMYTDYDNNPNTHNYGSILKDYVYIGELE